MMDLLLRYQSQLEQQVRDAAPWSGWQAAITKASLPWGIASLPAILILTLTSVQFWVVAALLVVPFLGLLFVQLTMLAQIVRLRRDRRNG